MSQTTSDMVTSSLSQKDIIKIFSYPLIIGASHCYLSLGRYSRKPFSLSYRTINRSYILYRAVLGRVSLFTLSVRTAGSYLFYMRAEEEGACCLLRCQETSLIQQHQLNFLHSFSILPLDSLPRLVFEKRLACPSPKGIIPSICLLSESLSLPSLTDIFRGDWSRRAWKKLVLSSVLATEYLSFLDSCDHLPLSHLVCSGCGNQFHIGLWFRVSRS